MIQYPQDKNFWTERHTSENAGARLNLFKYCLGETKKKTLITDQKSDTTSLNIAYSHYHTKLLQLFQVFREVLHPIKLEFGNVDFWGERKTGEKPLGAE